MSNTTGSTTFGDGLGTDLSLTTTSGPSAFLLNNAGNVTVAAAGTSNVSATGGAAVDATGGANGTYNLAFDDVDSRPAPPRASISTPSDRDLSANSSSTIAGAAGISSTCTAAPATSILLVRSATALAQPR